MTQYNPVANCDQFNDALADLLERELPESERAVLEAHALACADCGPLLADLRKLRVEAANLPELAPSRDLWAGIEARIETPVVELKTGEWAVRRQKRSRVWTGLAAAALVGVTATTTYLLTRRANVTTVPVNTVASAPQATLTSPVRADSTPAAPSTVGATANTAAPVIANTPSTTRLVSNAPEKLSAEATYSTEIARLRRIVKGRQSELDSSTVVVLEKNLRIIDDAIAQCRLALKKDPASAYLNESLNDALDNKVQLLRTAAGLPSKM